MKGLSSDACMDVVIIDGSFITKYIEEIFSEHVMPFIGFIGDEEGEEFSPMIKTSLMNGSNQG